MKDGHEMFFLNNYTVIENQFNRSTGKSRLNAPSDFKMAAISITIKIQSRTPAGASVIKYNLKSL